MRQLIYYVAVSLDGFIAGPDDQVDAFPVAGDHMRIIAEEFPETLPTHIRGHFGVADAPNRHFDTVLMGRCTYRPALDAGIASPYAHLNQYVASRSLRSDAVTVTDDPVRTARELKQQDGMDIWLAGGSALAAELYDEIDELRLKIYPLTLGAGRPLIATGYRPSGYRLDESRTSANGVVFARYLRAGMRGDSASL